MNTTKTKPPIEIDHNWFGTLTVENVHAIAAAMTKLLAGKRYTTTKVLIRSEGLRPGEAAEVRVMTGQQLEGEITAWTGPDESVVKTFAGISIYDTYGSYGASTSALDGGRIVRDPENAWIEFSPTQVSITHKSGSGSLLQWVFAVERPRYDE